MSWDLISKLLGPGFHWGKSQQEIKTAIQQAEAIGNVQAAEHLRLILKRRNEVMCEKETPSGGGT